MLELSGFQKDIWQQRYAMAGEQGWSDTARRVASAVAKAENENCMQEWEDKFYEIIAEGYFMPGGRILRNAGRKRQSMINCFISELNDDLNSISEFLKTTYMVSCFQGGFGYLGDVRPLGAPIAGENYAAPGIISTVKCIDDIGGYCRAGGGRRGAIWAGVRIKHPDCWYWIDAKKDTSALNNHNISVVITNEFLEAVEDNREWHFEWNNKPWYLFEVKKVSHDGDVRIIEIIAPDEEYAIGIGETFFKDDFRDKFVEPQRKRLKAKTLWQKIIDNASHDAGGEPGIINESLVQENFTASYYTNWIGQNGCTEITAGGPHDVCCLGHLNLVALYDDKKNDLDYPKLQEIIHTGVRFLDNVLTVNDYPMPEIKSASSRGRRIGLGFTGFAHLLIKMGIKYGSKKCINFMDRFMSTIRNESYKASIELAKEKGAFPAFDAEKHLQNRYIEKLTAVIKKDIRKFGLRNVAINMLAPTGTTSIVLNCSSSIEPIFAPVYKRKFRKGESLHEELLVDPLFEDILKSNGEIPKYFVGAYDVSVEEHLKVLSTAQAYLCMAISKTVNIPQDFNSEELADLILQYAPLIKSLTLYREGSRPDEPLTPIRVGSEEYYEAIQKKYDIGVGEVSCPKGTCEL